jgi:hypothetical protein
MTTTLTSNLTLSTSTSTTPILTFTTTIPIGIYAIHYAVRVNCATASSTTFTTLQSGINVNGGAFYASSMLTGSFYTDNGGTSNLGLTSTWVGRITSVQTPILNLFYVYTGVAPQALSTTGQGTYITVTRLG